MTDLYSHSGCLFANIKFNIFANLAETSNELSIIVVGKLGESKKHTILLHSRDSKVYWSFSNSLSIVRLTINGNSLHDATATFDIDPSSVKFFISCLNKALHAWYCHLAEIRRESSDSFFVDYFGLSTEIQVPPQSFGKMIVDFTNKNDTLTLKFDEKSTPIVLRMDRTVSEQAYAKIRDTLCCMRKIEFLDEQLYTGVKDYDSSSSSGIHMICLRDSDIKIPYSEFYNISTLHMKIVTDESTMLSRFSCLENFPFELGLRRDHILIENMYAMIRKIRMNANATVPNYRRVGRMIELNSDAESTDRNTQYTVEGHSFRKILIDPKQIKIIETIYLKDITDPVLKIFMNNSPEFCIQTKGLLELLTA